MLKENELTLDLITKANYSVIYTHMVSDGKAIENVMVLHSDDPTDIANGITGVIKMHYELFDLHRVVLDENKEHLIGEAARVFLSEKGIPLAPLSLKEITGLLQRDRICRFSQHISVHHYRIEGNIKSYTNE